MALESSHTNPKYMIIMNNKIVTITAVYIDRLGYEWNRWGDGVDEITVSL